MRTSLVMRILGWVIAAVVGAVYGVAGTVGHAVTWGPVPVGLIAAVIGSGCLLVAIRLLTDDRWATLAAGLGMTATVLLFSGAGPGGSVLVPQAADGEISSGMIWTFAVPLLVAVTVAWPSRFGVADAAPSGGEGPDAAR